MRKRLAGDSRLMPHQFWLVVMARDESPESSVFHDRNRHGGRDSHVAKVFHVNGRHRAQDTERHVQRRPGNGIQSGNQSRAACIHIRLQPQGVDRVKTACLRRYVRSRIAQTEKRNQIRLPVFGNNGAGVVLQESIDHHSVKACYTPDAAGEVR